MVKVKENLTGKHFNRLRVIKQAEDYIYNGIHSARWECKCDCGSNKVIIASSYDLKSGKTRSCGCYKRDKLYIRSKKYNIYDLSGDYGIGWTANTNREFYFDLEDYDKIKDYCWREAQLSEKYHTLITHIPNSEKNTPMHELIFGLNADHINRNPFDNRKLNLREATKSQNTYNSDMFSTNTSGIRGVNKSKNSYRAYIGDVNEGTYHTQYFQDKKLAILRRLTWELIYAGEYAPQLELIKKEYPYLLGYFKVKDTMTFTDDMQTIYDIGQSLISDPHCPCSPVKTENTICPCIACRKINQCHCELFVPKN